MEKDDEVKGEGNSLDFGSRIYDTRLGRWLSVDPQTGKFPFESPYGYVSNSPLIYIDPNGESKYIVFREINEQTGKTTEIKVLVDAEILEAVRVDVPNSLSPRTADHDEWDYYDINEVHTTVIKEDGTKIVKPVKSERGDYRAHTWYKLQAAANFLKEENEMEEKASEGLTGIRWTTSSTGASGQGNSHDNGRKFIRSENIDMLLAVLSFANSTAAGSSKNLTKAPKSLKDVLEKVSASNDVVDGKETLEELYDDVKEADRYNSSGHTCSSCSGERHDDFDYEDREGNKMDGQTGDTLERKQ